VRVSSVNVRMRGGAGRHSAATQIAFVSRSRRGPAPMPPWRDHECSRALRPVRNTTAITCFVFTGAVLLAKKPQRVEGRLLVGRENRAAGERVRALAADVIGRPDGP
jgi:hypothetical protein